MNPDDAPPTPRHDKPHHLPPPATLPDPPPDPGHHPAAPAVPAELPDLPPDPGKKGHNTVFLHQRGRYTLDLGNLA